jgi:hypothetical protein
METRDLLEQVNERAIVSLDSEDLPKVLAVAEPLRAVDTGLAGWIRIVSIDGHILVQEQTLEGEVLVRKHDSRGAAERFVERRLADYERMWDGCGCKIDYHL